MQFPSSVSAVKTLAHATLADIDKGLSTHWEKAANGHADRLAKLGASDHSLPEEAVKEFFGLLQLVREAARWAGEHEAWLSDLNFRDASSIVDPPLVAKGGVRSDSRHEPSPAERRDQLKQHSLVAADVMDGPPQQSVIACLACGAFAWQRRGLLRRKCRGKAESSPRKGQRGRFLAGLFPGAREWKISAPRSLTADEQAWLNRAGSGKSAPGRTRSAGICKGSGIGCETSVAGAAAGHTEQGPFLDKELLLLAFGVESSSDLQCWARRGRRPAEASCNAAGMADLEDALSDLDDDSERD